jgi:diaminohydroxyphosphoribosylaminopyrimidine deaminase/5-amino-6-(5-phosphoribosylamino)uracil reductase
MRKALRLAERGRGRTSPNPMVGALVVDGTGVIVGRGAHEVAGGPHAEVIALRDAGTRAEGATLYCTLEPCTHAGRTGPCAPQVADARVSRVVVAMADPNPVAAGGSAYLRSRGVDVTVGTLADEARRLNAAFLTRVSMGRPLVIIKIAVSLDGRIAQGRGMRTALTGEVANRLIHLQRAEVDAIAVGVGTVLVDDPMLTARGAYRFRPLARVLYDRNLALRPSARVFSTMASGPVIIVSSERAINERPADATALRATGAELLSMSNGGTIRGSLDALGRRGISSIVVEGGTRLHQAFWDAGVVDRVQMYVTDRVLGDSGVEWLPTAVLSSDRIRQREARPLGTDVLLEGYVHGAD